MKKKNKAAQKLGSLGGKQRAINLSPERRMEISTNAIKALKMARNKAKKGLSTPSK